jgi:hypothetical protein
VCVVTHCARLFQVSLGHGGPGLWSHPYFPSHGNKCPGPATSIDATRSRYAAKHLAAAGYAR